MLATIGVVQIKFQETTFYQTVVHRTQKVSLQDLHGLQNDAVGIAEV